MSAAGVYVIPAITPCLTSVAVMGAIGFHMWKYGSAALSIEAAMVSSSYHFQVDGALLSS